MAKDNDIPLSQAIWELANFFPGFHINVLWCGVDSGVTTKGRKNT